MEYITVKKVAELKGCSVRYVKKLAHDGKLEAKQEINPQNNCLQYLIPISALPEDLQNRYYAEIKGSAQLCLPKPAEASCKPEIKRTKTVIRKEFGQFSQPEREEITFWTDLIREWRIRRKEYENLNEGDMCFIAETKRLRREYLAEHGIQLSKDILYRKYRAYKENDLQGLTDGRGAWNKGQNSIPSPVLECFTSLYLNDNELPVSDCYRLTKAFVSENYPEYMDMASERTFRRQAQQIPEAVMKFFRKSQKECIDECLPYIERLYDDIEANDVWVADNHTFDFVTKTDDGEKNHRLYITGILDAKSGALVGWNITENPSSHSTVLALRHAIMRCGIPKKLYVDNGTEFLTHDIGGKGHRARKSQANIPNPPTILNHLGIEMVNALVCNGRAKPIERMFLTLKNTISRATATFTGGNIIERPESLKYQLKHGIVPYDMEIREKLDILLDGQYNAAAYNGYEKKQFEGLSHAEAWCKSIQRRTLRMCDESTLNLLLMRTSRYQKVRENGVYITISGEKLWYNCGEENWRWVGQEVYVRYDPAELEYVRIYDKDDTFIGNWQMDLSIFVDYITSNNDDIAARQSLIARQIRQIKACGEELTGGMKIDALALAVAEAHKNIDKVQFTKPTNIEPVIIKEEAETLKKASGGDEIIIDLEKMAHRAARNKNTFNFEED